MQGENSIEQRNQEIKQQSPTPIQSYGKHISTITPEKIRQNRLKWAYEVCENIESRKLFQPPYFPYEIQGTTYQQVGRILWRGKPKGEDAHTVNTWRLWRAKVWHIESTNCNNLKALLRCYAVLKETKEKAAEDWLPIVKGYLKQVWGIDNPDSVIDDICNFSREHTLCMGVLPNEWRDPKMYTKEV